MLTHNAAANSAGLPSPLWGGVGGGGDSWRTHFMQTTTTPLPSPPPQGGREQAEFVARADSNSSEHALTRRARGRRLIAWLTGARRSALRRGPAVLHSVGPRSIPARHA